MLIATSPTRHHTSRMDGLEQRTSTLVEHFQELRDRLHGQTRRQREKVIVARDEQRARGFGDREDAVVIWILRARGRGRRIVRDDRGLLEQLDEGRRLALRDPRTQLRVRERETELRQEERRDDQLELAGKPALDCLRRTSFTRQQRGDQDV